MKAAPCGFCNEEYTYFHDCVIGRRLRDAFEAGRKSGDRKIKELSTALVKSRTEIQDLAAKGYRAAVWGWATERTKLVDKIYRLETEAAQVLPGCDSCEDMCLALLV